MASFGAKISWTLLFVAAAFRGTCSQDDEDYLYPEDNEELQYCSSKVFPRQISVVNSSAQVGVVVDSISERILILNGETGKGMVIDKRLGIGCDIEETGWSTYEQSLEDYLKDCDVSGLVEQNSRKVFQLDEQSPQSAVSVKLKRSLQQFSPSFLTQIMKDGGDVLKAVKKNFGYIMYPLKQALSTLLDAKSPVWISFKGGFAALLNIFKWTGKLIGHIAGGIAPLIKAGIVWSLSAIIRAQDGAKALCIVLKSIAMKVNLINLLKFLVKSPAQIAKFMVGLGGMVLKGVTGILCIITKLFTLNVFKIASAVKSFTKMILNFLRGTDRPDHDVFKSSIKELMDIPAQQQRRYKNQDQFGEYKQFLGSMAGEGDYAIQGIKVAPLVKVVTQKSSSAKVVLMSTLKMINPVVPFNIALPQLLVNMVKSLNDSQECSYVQQLLPGIKIPTGGLQEPDTMAVMRSAIAVDSLEDMQELPTDAVFKSLPVIGDIYRELDEAAHTYSNSSLDSMLEGHHVGEIVEFTTKAMGLV